MDDAAGSKGKTLGNTNGKAHQDLELAERDVTRFYPDDPTVAKVAARAAFKAEETITHAHTDELYGSSVEDMGRGRGGRRG
jgi:hypothetical protein